MVEQIFDPQLFNYTWESAIENDDYVVGTYYIKDIKEDCDFIDHLSQVKRLVLEGSTSSWVQVEEDTPELREKLTSKLIGYYEIPAPKGTKKAVIQLAFPIGHWDVKVNIPMLLLSIAGNYSAFPTHIRLVDLYIPQKVAGQFQGPKFGIEGVRELLGVPERPLHLHIIKPKMGMTPRATAAQVYETGTGGADLCKDDEMLSELSYCTMGDRLEAVAEAVDRVEQDSGHKMLYMLSITDEADKVRDKARWAADNGASGLLLAYTAGMSTLRVLAEDPAIDVPILLHVSHMLALLPHINFPVLSKLCRLCGADMMLSPSIWSS
ncbi:MAG: RuBisCO large subunit C-terminal-like domain-containing protein, partial [Anaerolineae bacterium]